MVRQNAHSKQKNFEDLCDAIGHGVPDLGEHGPQILETLLHQDKDRIAALVDMGILGRGAVTTSAAA